MAFAIKDRSGKLTGQWQGQVMDKAIAGGRRFRRAFETKREAEAYEAYVRMMGAEPPTVLDGIPQPQAGRSFKEIAEQCMAAGGPRGVWERERDHSVFQRLETLITMIGAYDIGDVTRSLVREKVIGVLKSRVKPGRARQPLSQGTINRYVTALSAVLTWAMHEDIIDHKPELPFAKETDRQEREAVSFELEDAACAWLEEHYGRTYAVCIRFLAATGLRRGELYALAPEQIGNDHITLKREQTKTNRPRLVYVPEDLAREMRAIIANGLLPEPTHLLKTFQAACAAAGNEKNVCLHSLRHTRNTRLRKAGVEEKLRMEILGHTSAQVNRGYDHIDLDDQRAAAKLVEKMSGKAEPSGEIVPLHPAVKAM